MGLAALQPMGQRGLRSHLWQTKDSQEESRHRSWPQDRRVSLGLAPRWKRLGSKTDAQRHGVLRQGPSTAQRNTSKHEAQREQRPTQEPTAQGIPRSQSNGCRRQFKISQPPICQIHSLSQIHSVNQIRKGDSSTKQRYEKVNGKNRIETKDDSTRKQTTASKKASICGLMHACSQAPEHRRTNQPCSPFQNHGYEDNQKFRLMHQHRRTNRTSQPLYNDLY